MSSILCEAFKHTVRCFTDDEEVIRVMLSSGAVPVLVPPVALFCSSSIFSALAPRASRLCLLTPPLLSLLRRSPFFCFTQTFFLAFVTDADVCQIIRECVAIKSLRIVSDSLTGSFIQDAILSSDGGFITRSLEDLVFDHCDDSECLLPLLCPRLLRCRPSSCAECS